MATLQQKELLQIKVMLVKYKEYNKPLAELIGEDTVTSHLRAKAKDRIGILEDILDALNGDLVGLKRLTAEL